MSQGSEGRGRRRLALLLLLLAPLLAAATSGCSAIRSDPAETASPPPALPADYVAPTSLNPPKAARMEGFFPNIVLVTQDEERVRFYDDLLKDKVVVINFMYTSCDGI